MQDSLGIPLPASVQWEIVAAAAIRIRPVFDELIRQAAQGDVLHNDDTSMMVLNLRRQIDIEDETDHADRTGIFTTGIVSTREGCKIALFFTGRQHAGENLRDILVERAAVMKAPFCSINSTAVQ